VYKFKIEIENTLKDRS